MLTINLDRSKRFNVTTRRNSAWSFLLRKWADEARTEPADLTGRTYVMKVFKANGDEVYSIDGVIDGQNVRFPLAYEDNDAAAGTYRHEVRETQSGNTTVEGSGSFVIKS
jgi:hypothetical protein